MRELIGFLKFNAVGVINTLVDTAIYSLLVLTGLDVVIAQVISYCAGVLNSYIFNSLWTFRDKQTSTRKILLFILVNLISLSAALGVISLCTEQFGMDKYIAKLVSLPFSLLINFVGSRFLVFKSPNT